MTEGISLEVRFRWLSIAAVVLFGAALAAGMVLHLASPGSVVSARLLQIGLVALMAAPGVRIVIAVAERIRTRDWPFVLLALTVVIELAIVLWRASARG